MESAGLGFASAGLIRYRNFAPARWMSRGCITSPNPPLRTPLAGAGGKAPTDATPGGTPAASPHRAADAHSSPHMRNTATALSVAVLALTNPGWERQGHLADTAEADPVRLHLPSPLELFSKTDSW
jgi:hypothetical protein